MMLPQNSTTNSYKLAQIAQKIVSHAPSNALEIILDGSVARGLADQFSDIELQFFSEQAPSIPDILTWMQSIGFQGDPLVRVNEPNKKLINDVYDNVRIELYWTSFDYEAEQLDGIMECIGGSQFINEPYKWSDAITLRDGQHITQWKSLFEQYPDTVRERYIQPVLDDWRIALNDPIDSLGRWKDAYRQAWFYLLKTHWLDVLPLLRLIFAYNRIWFPVAKWWHAAVPKLTHKPKNIIADVNTIISHPDPVVRVDQLSQLQIEALHLIKTEYEVQDLLDKLQLVREYGLKLGQKQNSS